MERERDGASLVVSPTHFYMLLIGGDVKSPQNVFPTNQNKPPPPQKKIIILSLSDTLSVIEVTDV